jgi:hypothetical protein
LGKVTAFKISRWTRTTNIDGRKISASNKRHVSRAQTDRLTLAA